MIEEYEKKKRKEVSMMRSVMDYGMGVVFVLFGFFFLFHEKLNVRFRQFPSSWVDKLFGGICILYGVWRIYRGYKKNYFR
jgi:hypothetical protein